MPSTRASAAIAFSPPDVGLVERRVHFVQQAEGRRAIMKDAEHQGERRHSLLAAREQQHILKALARRLGHNVDAGLQHIVGVYQTHLAAPAAEEFLEERAEVAIDFFKGMTETLARAPLDLAQRFL